MMKVFAQPHTGTRGANGGAGSLQRSINKNTGVSRASQGNYNRNRGIAQQMAARLKRGLQG